jgi:glucose-6-phosphate 1-dehydrogenase
LVFFGASGDLAVPPSAFATVVAGLGKSGCAVQARVAVEKPFGRDLESARALDAIEAQWRIVDRALDLPAAPLPYAPGTWGPSEADRLVAAAPGGWHEPIDPRERCP